jgi:D-alanyl-lipoteichoic acid acyltransferase DltB (MBOAT superfamily)
MAAVSLAQLVQIGLYLVHLAVLYLLLIPRIGAGVLQKCLAHRHCSWYLRDGGVDSADGQWRDFRSSLPLLAGALVATAGAHAVLVWMNLSPSVTTYVRLVIGLVFAVVQHGYHAGIVLVLAVIGFLVPTKFVRGVGGRSAFAAVWGYGLLVLLFKESYRIKHLFPLILTPLFDKASFGGQYAWQLSANFLILRIISFGLDYSWRKQELNGQPDSAGISDPDSTYTVQTKTSVPIDSDYSFINYLAYVLYVPLYIAGPILRYDDYISQAKRPQPPIPNGALLRIRKKCFVPAGIIPVLF